MYEYKLGATAKNVCHMGSLAVYYKNESAPLRRGGKKKQRQMAFAIIPLLYQSFSHALSQKPIWLIKCFVCSVALIHFGHVIGSGYKPGTRSH